MPGQRATVTEELKDGMTYKEFYFTNAMLTGVQHVPLFVCEKRTAIEQVVIRYETAESAGADTFKLSYQVSGKTLGAGGADVAIDITNTIDPKLTANTNYTFALAGESTADGPTNNIVPAGAVVFLHANAGIGNIGRVTLRVRTQTKLF